MERVDVSDELSEVIKNTASELGELRQPDVRFSWDMLPHLALGA